MWRAPACCAVVAPGERGAKVPTLTCPPPLLCLPLCPRYPSYEQHQNLIAEMQCHPEVTLEMLVGDGWAAGGACACS